MPIPILLGIIGLAVAGSTAGVVGHCAMQVNDDFAAELDCVNDEMEEMWDKTNKNILNSKETIEVRVKDLHIQRKSVYETSLTNFEKVFSKIKNVNFVNYAEFKTDMLRFEQNLSAYKEISSNRFGVFSDPTAPTANIVRSVLLGAGPALILGLVKGVKLQYQIDEAKAERSKVRAECEAAKKQCLKLDSISEYCKRLESTILTLKNLADQSIIQVASVISVAGLDYESYDKTQRQEVRIAYNFVMALNDLVNIEVFNDNGEINPNLEKYVNSLSDLIKSEGK